MFQRHLTRRAFVRNGALASASGALPLGLFAAQASDTKDASHAAFGISSTATKQWQTLRVLPAEFQWDLLNLNVDTKATAQTIEGFGSCFSELGWVALSALSAADRDSVMRELFHPSEGARFSYCRMPIGANDYAREAYSYDEADKDFALRHFSIAHDRDSLVPFIHAAQKQQPALKLWASPWTPPSWMKRNHFYAEAKSFGGMKDNGIRPDQIGREGEDMFVLEEPYLQAYASYFGRFIDAYRAEGISVSVVMPQNEFNSAQNFPSCTWTAQGLAKFIQHLGPEMAKRDVDVFFGTLDRGDPQLLQTVLDDPEAGKYIKGVGVQWAGKNALPAIAKAHPRLSIFQSEQECGDGKNTWAYVGYCWQLMKHYLRSGVSGYMYWNTATPKGGVSTWGWQQNSLVSVDMQAKTFAYNPDYYLLKHLSHFVDVRAKRLEATGTCDDSLAFANPNGSVAVLLRNAASHPVSVQVVVDRREPVMVMLPPDSLNSVRL